MTPDTAALLKSRLARAKADHIARLHRAGTNALDQFKPMQMGTYGPSLGAYISSIHVEISDHANRVRQEVLGFVNELLLPLNESDKREIEAIADLALDPALYPERLKIQEESMGRHAGRMGIGNNEWLPNNDLVRPEQPQNPHES